jgi:hypothetical protein
MAKTTRMTSNVMKDLPLGTDAAHVRKRIEAMEQLLERTFVIPGTKQTVGLDVILDIIPVGGDFIAAALGLYMVWEARNLKMPGSAVMRMLGNVGFDWLLGLIPFVGIVPDFFFRSNSRNLRIIRRHLDKHYPNTVTVDHK